MSEKDQPNDSFDNKIYDTELLENFNRPNNITYTNFLIIWIGQLVSLLGSEIVQFAIIWWVTLETENPTILSLNVFFAFLPRIFLAPLAGVIADRKDRKKILMITDGTQAIITGGIILIFFVSEMKIWIIIGMNLLRSVCQTFHSPASSSIRPLMIPKELLSRMNGLSQLASSVIMTLGPIFGALFLSFLTIQEILWIDILTFGIALVCLLRVPIPKIKPTQAAKNTQNAMHNQPSNSLKPKGHRFLQEFKEGLHTIFRIRGLTPIIGIVILANFFLTPLTTLFTFFIQNDHQGNALQYALVAGCFQSGMIFGGILVSLKKEWQNKIRGIIFGIFLIFFGITAIGLIPKGMFGLLAIVSFVATLGSPLMHSLLMTLIQTSVPPEKMGRVFSNLNMISSLIMPIGMLSSGPLAEILGTGTLISLGGVLGMITVGLIYYLSDLHLLNDETFGNTTIRF
ncbi:MFS transporter [Candidatus Lokiarchaeum ossiferum]|uniref:MFS transporter n=1 Tax=Candidatus Lokiarchaeum ossiferum TaxID=2951803 RepID=UPI00352D4A69